MTRTIAALAVLAAFLFSSSARAQGPPPRPLQAPPGAPQIFQDADTAHETRMQLERLLRQYPPTVGEVLMRDPSLLNQADYLAPYPALIAFLAQHPEVARNPGFWMLPFAADFRIEDPSLAPSLLIALGALACLVLTPIVVYFVLSDE